MGDERKRLWTGLLVEPQREVDRAMRLLTEHRDVWGVAVKERRSNNTDDIRADVVISCKRCRASTLREICCPRYNLVVTPRDENSKRAFWHSLKSRTGYKILKDASPTLPKTKKRRPDKKRPTPGNALGLKAPAIIYDFLTSRDYCRLQAALKSSKKIEAGHAGVAEFWCRMRATASGAKPRKARRSTSTAATATPQSSTAPSTPPQLQDRRYAGGGRTRVFVAGLDPAVQWYDLKDFFREAGFDVVYASVSAHADGSSKGCGVVQLASAEDCDVAIRDLNGAALRGTAIAVREDRQERRRRGRGEAPPRAAARDAFSDRRGAFDEFGGLLPWVGAGDAPLPAEVLALLADRDDARDAKDYAAADAIRDDVRDLYELRIDDRNRRCLPHAPPVAPRAPPTATVKAESDEAVVAALAGDVSFLDAPAEEATFDVSDIDLDSILAKHGDAMRAALAEDAAPDTVASAAAPDASAEDRDALAALRVPELKDRCRAAGLKVGGKKAELIDRLLGVE